MSIRKMIALHPKDSLADLTKPRMPLRDLLAIEPVSGAKKSAHPPARERASARGRRTYR